MHEIPRIYDSKYSMRYVMQDLYQDQFHLSLAVFGPAVRTLTFRVNLFIDNSTVVMHLCRLLKVGFDPFVWASGPDTDLWSALAAEIISRPPGMITVTKVKSHLDPEWATNSRDRWLILGNSKADSLAKQALSIHSRTRVLWNSSGERQAINYAFLASQFLHDLSDKVFALCRSQTAGAVGETLCPQARTLPDPRTFQVWSFQTLSSFPYDTWDKNFMLLLQHYFTLLVWPQGGWEHDPGISLLEIMLDFCITFQTRLPINVAANRLRSPGIPVLPPKSPAKYVLLTRKPARTLPPPSKASYIPSSGHLTSCM